MNFDISYLYAQRFALLDGLWLTVGVSALSILFSVAIGVLGAAIKDLRLAFLPRVVDVYVNAIRNTPILVQLFFIYYGLPAAGISLDGFWSGTLCLSLWAGAYQVENLRGGLITVPDGLREAALALNLKKLAYMRYVAIPTALRTSIPSMLNTAISLLKNSSYLQVIGFQELTFVAVDRTSMDFRAVEMFTAIGVIYLLLVTALSIMTRFVDRKLHQPLRT